MWGDLTQTIEERLFGGQFHSQVGQDHPKPKKRKGLTKPVAPISKKKRRVAKKGQKSPVLSKKEHIGGGREGRGG